MKFEIIQTSSNVYSYKDFILYITRNEIIKLYEENKDLCYSSIGVISEMFTTPNCFHSTLDSKEIDILYNGLLEHKSYKGVLLSIHENESGNRRSLSIAYRTK